MVILLIVVYGMMPSAFAAFDISKSGDLTATEFDEVGFDTTGLVGYWQLNGNANDSSGQGNNGTIVGATATTDRFGTANMAMSFNGSNNYIAVASPSGLPTGTSPRTLALWFKKSNNTVWSKEVVGYGTNGSHNRFAIFLPDATKIGAETINNSHYISWTANTDWNHIVLVLPVGGTKASDVKVYLNGIEGTYVVSDNATLTTTSSPFWIGALPTIATGYNFDGSIDEVKIFNRALSAAEILSMYNHEKGKFSVGKDGTMKALEFVEDPTLPVQMRSKKKSLTVKGQLIEQ